MVACLFAGVGAWGAKVEVSNTQTYASELFGAGHSAIKYPADGEPVVTLTIPANVGPVTANAAGEGAAAAMTHNGSAEITFTLGAGAFAANVTGLMWNNGTTEAPAPGTVASIIDGGRADQNHITIKVEEADPAATDATKRDGTVPAAVTYDATATPPVTAGTAHTVTQSISFEMPRLKGLESLAGANAKMPEKSIKLHIVSRVVSGQFTDGKLSSKGPDPKAPGEKVVLSRDSLTLEITDPNTKTIALKDDADKGLTAFKSVKEKNKDGYVHLATVTIATEQVSKAAKDAAGEKVMYYIDTDGTKHTGTLADDCVGAGISTDGDVAGCYNRNSVIFSGATAGNKTEYHELLDLDGKEIDEGLRGNFMVNAMGTRDLFNEDDMLFVDYDNNGKMGGSEGIVIDGDMAMGSALSIDADESESFPDGITGSFNVYYMPGGKGDINHGAMIKLTAMVDYSDPTAIDEAPAKSSTTMNFDGVNAEVMAYAIPHSTNGTGDKANVRVRCEASAGCRVFVECWDDDGMRNFGEAGMIEGNALMKWDAEAVEGVIGVDAPTSRHSCRILSAGMVTVQQLTRDGNSKTLVNNTYVGDGHAGVMDIVNAAEARIMGQIKDTH